MMNSHIILQNAQKAGVGIPAFNVPYLPMARPIIQAVVDQDSFAFLEVARIEWVRGEAGGPAEVLAEFRRWERPDYVRLHLDHVPVVDETQARVDYLPIFREALRLGYHSVMVDASRLELDENIAATRQVVELAHAQGVPVEAELGSVLGHGDVKPPPYEDLFSAGTGFTKVEEARRFVQESGCDWLSVAVGTIHGPFANLWKDEQKPQARLKLDLVEELSQATGVPLVLHGGSGVRQADLLEGVRRGIAKINVGTEIRQPYEACLRNTGSVEAAQEAVYLRTCWLLKEYFGWAGDRARVLVPPSGRE
jgi:ketose-bisphosphate aldolase